MIFKYKPLRLTGQKPIELQPHLLSGNPRRNERRNKIISRLERLVISNNLQIYESTFISPIQTEYPSNNRGIVRHFKSESKSAVLVLPKRGTYGYKFHELIAAYLATNGITSYTIETPYHGSRRIQNTKGGMPTDLEKLSVVFQQAITETMGLVALIKEENGNAKVGICGVSLGAIIASEIYGIDDVSSACLIMGGGNLPDLFLKSKDGFMKYLRGQLLSSGMSEEQLRSELIERFAEFEPCKHTNPDKKDNLLMIKANLDRYVPPECVEILRKSWGNPEMYSIPLGHFGVVIYLPLLLPKILNHFRRTLA